MRSGRPSKLKNGIAVLGGACAILSLGACPSTDTTVPPSCALPFIGDKSQPPQIQLVYADSDNQSHPVTEGGAIPMLLPLQGGRVIYAGARVMNVDPCAALLTGSLRDPDNNQVRFDTRTINLTRASDGWGEASAGDLSAFSNIPACPNEWSTKSIFEGTYLLSVKIKDRGGRTVEGQAHVTPACAAPNEAADCRCICQAGYVLGQQCPSGVGGSGSSSSSASTTNGSGG